jgi:molecular chaperone DnaK (HSP70)
MKTIGIDFGTTKTLVATMEGHTTQPRAIRLGRRGYDLPTTVHADSNSCFLFGDDADDQLALDPANYLRRIKRHLGTKKEFVLGGHRYGAVLLVRKFLEHIKTRVEEEDLHGPIDHAVITVPAKYGPAARADLSEAAANAGFPSVELLDEPIAAGIAFLHAKSESDLGSEVLVFDWGGGTLDIAMVERSGNDWRLNYDLLEGDPQLGGEDIDEALLEVINDSLCARGLPRVSRDNTDEYPQLYQRVVDMKRLLSKKESHSFKSYSDKLPFEFSCTRSSFTDFIAAQLDRAFSCLSKWEALAATSGKHANRILLVGGSSQIPAVGERIASLGMRPVLWTDALQAVALGAAIHAFRQEKRNPPQSQKFIAMDEYRKLLEAAFLDKEISTKEKDLLCEKKAKLKLSEAEALSLELQVIGQPLECRTQAFESGVTSKQSAPPKHEESTVTDNDSLAQAKYEEAVYAMQKGDADVAIQNLSLCAILSPSHANARELLVNAFIAKNDLQSAMISAKTWTDANPDNLRAWTTFGSIAFKTEDFSTSARILSQNVNALDAEGLLLLAASLFRLGKASEVRSVLERIQTGEKDRIIKAAKCFLLPWIKVGFDYDESDLRNYSEALAGWRSLTSNQSATMKSILAWFNVSLQNFILTAQIEMLYGLLNLKRGNLRDSLDALYHLCKGKIDFEIAWSSRDPNLMGRILAGTLCRYRKIKLAADLVTEMCLRNPSYDIRLIQGEADFRDCVNDPRVHAFFEPDLSVTENHGAIFNDVTVINRSIYKVTNVEVRVHLARQEGKRDAPFTLHFREILPGITQSKHGVFKNAGWFGGDVENVEAMVVACDQKFHYSRTGKRRKAPPEINGLSSNGDDALTNWSNFFSDHSKSAYQQCGICPRGHGPMRMWEGRHMCWTCGYPDK